MNVTQPPADNALRQLQEAGGLSKPRTVHGEGQKRNVVWQATQVLEALDRLSVVATKAFHPATPNSTEPRAKHPRPMTVSLWLGSSSPTVDRTW